MTHFSYLILKMGHSKFYPYETTGKIYLSHAFCCISYYSPYLWSGLTKPKNFKDWLTTRTSNSPNRSRTGHQPKTFLVTPVCDPYLKVPRKWGSKWHGFSGETFPRSPAEFLPSNIGTKYQVNNDVFFIYVISNNLHCAPLTFCIFFADRHQSRTSEWCCHGLYYV